MLFKRNENEMNVKCRMLDNLHGDALMVQEVRSFGRGRWQNIGGNDMAKKKYM